MTERCGDCRFAGRGREDEFSCHRFPPQAASEGYSPTIRFRFVFPAVSYHDWCGEFEPKEER